VIAFGAAVMAAAGALGGTPKERLGTALLLAFVALRD